MPIKRDLALENIPLSKQPFETQPQIKNEDATLIHAKEPCGTSQALANVGDCWGVWGWDLVSIFFSIQMLSCTYVSSSCIQIGIQH
jgi:hypothetical protein